MAKDLTGRGINFGSSKIPFVKSKPEDKDGDNLWRGYLEVVNDEDKASIKRWEGSASGLLTFVRHTVLLVDS